MKCAECRSEIVGKAKTIKCVECEEELHVKCMWKVGADKAAYTCLSCVPVLKQLPADTPKWFEAFAVILLKTQKALLQSDQENLRLKQKCKKLEMEVVKVNQYSRRDNIEISGIPARDGECTDAHVVKIAEIMGADIQASDVFSHRVPRMTKTDKKGNQLHPNIVVKFVNRKKKMHFMQKKKEYMRNKQEASRGSGNRRQIFLKASEINSDFDGSAVYIQEHLCPELKQLHRKCRDQLKEIDCKYFWISAAQEICVKLEEQSEVIKVWCEEDLEQFTALKAEEE